MKKTLTKFNVSMAFALISSFLIFSCQSQSGKPGTSDRRVEKIDIAHEKSGIERTRNSFTTAIKEKRYEDLAQWVTPDMISVVPAAPEWQAMRKLRADMGPFPYDSITMHPTETVILNDSSAYDFGNSSVYYTDEKGEVVELQDTYLVILKKGNNDRWLLHREVASGNVMKP